MLVIYLMLSVAVLAFIVKRPTVFSYTCFTLVVLFVATLFYLPVSHTLPLALVLLLLLLPVLRLITLIVNEVIFTQSKLGKRGSLLALRKTTLLWLPFPILALVGYYILSVRNEHITQSVDQLVYGAEVSEQSLVYGCGPNFNLVCRCAHKQFEQKQTIGLAPHDCPLVDISYYRVNKNAGNMEKDIHTTVERLKLTFRKDIVNRLNTELDKNRQKIKNQGGNLESAIFGSSNRSQANRTSRRQQPIIQYKLSDYHPDLEPPICNGVIDQIFKLRDCVKNIMLEPLSNAYQDIREDLRQELQSNLDDGEKNIDKNITLLKNRIEFIVDQRLKHYSLNAHHSVETGFTFFRIIKQLSFLIWLGLVAYALFVGFLYLYVRYVYNQNFGKVAFQTSPGDSDIKKSNVIHMEDITIDEAMNSFEQTLDGMTWYASMDNSLRYEVDGIISLPKPLTLFFKRIPNKYLFFRYSQQEGKSSINAHADDLTRFVKIKLQKDQTIAFQFSSLVAFSKNVKMNAAIHLPLAAFFQNQLFFSTATGPGELIFQAKGGKPELMPQGGIKPSDPRDVIVFDIKGQYALLADLNPLSAYFLGHRVMPKENTALIRQSPESKSTFSSQATAVRRTLYLLMPLTFITLVLPWLLP
jgi:hypothetical protein